jgi:hypothetical protein
MASLFHTSLFYTGLFSQGGSLDADSMLAAGGGYTGTTVTEGNLSMLILCDRRIRISLSPFRHAQIWAMERLLYVNCASGDIRWAILALAVRSFSPLWAFGQHQLGCWIRKLAGRLASARSLAARFSTTADSMVAAGGG